MRSFRLGSWLAAFAALACFEGRAQAVEPLETFLERAKTQSFDAREAVATSEQRSGEADASLGRILPAFTARGTYQYNVQENEFPLNGRTIVLTPHHVLDASFLLEVPIIDLANYHRYQAAKALARGAEEQRGATGIDVSRSVARSYYQ